jgi:signal transduction histidine kinase
MVVDHPKEMDDKILKKYLFLIKDAGANAMSLLENLLEWAKTQSGEIVAQKENISINYILRGNVLLIKEMARQKNIELIEKLEGNPSVYIDNNMINTVIRNLLSNALKFTTNGGKIWVKTIINNDEVKIIVQDSGVGISDELLSNLFEPGVVKRGLDGMASSGLGLILCKEFLLQHRQELRVDSKLNFGTTFWFYLPLSE